MQCQRNTRQKLGEQEQEPSSHITCKNSTMPLPKLTSVTMGLEPDKLQRRLRFASNCQEAQTHPDTTVISRVTKQQIELNGLQLFPEVNIEADRPSNRLRLPPIVVPNNTNNKAKKKKRKLDKLQRTADPPSAPPPHTPCIKSARQPSLPSRQGSLMARVKAMGWCQMTLPDKYVVRGSQVVPSTGLRTRGSNGQI